MKFKNVKKTEKDPKLKKNGKKFNEHTLCP